MDSTDLEVLFGWRNDLDFMALCSTRRNELGFEEFSEELERDFERDRHLQFMIVAKEAIVGTIYSYNFNPTDGHVFITIFIEKQHTRMGVGANAFVLFGSYLFENFPLHKIYLDIYSYNHLALKTALKGGFKEEGRLKEHRLFNERRWDLIRLAFYRRQLPSTRKLINYLTRR